MESMELCLKNFAFQTQLIRWVRSGRSEWLRFLDQGGRKLPWYFRPSQLFPLELSVREWCSPLDRLPPQKRLVLGLRRLDHPFVWWRLRRSQANLLSSGIREVRHVTVDGDDFYSRRYRMQSFFCNFYSHVPYSNNESNNDCPSQSRLFFRSEVLEIGDRMKDYDVHGNINMMLLQCRL